MLLVTDHGYLDIFDYIPGYPEAPANDLFDNALQTDHGKFVSLSWLRRMKSATNCVKDKLDLENLPTPESGN